MQEDAIRAIHMQTMLIERMLEPYTDPDSQVDLNNSAFDSNTPMQPMYTCLPPDVSAV